ncbi:MAG TPA: MFS transporter, partial [Opitutaceae bacterium]
EPPQIGLLLTLTLLGDAAISLALSSRADRWGRRRTLWLGALLMFLGGLGIAATGNFLLLVIAATIGVISPSGSEVGPFLAVEQACLAQVVRDRDRTRLFAWYNVAGYLATAAGALVAGALSSTLQAGGWSPLASYRVLLVGYASIGLGLGVLAGRLGAEIEAPPQASARAGPHLLGLRESRGLVAKLSALFALDAFAGGFILQSVLAWWFHERFAASDAALGALFFGTNLLSGLSALAAVPIARRIGLVNTMVWTHLPSNLLLLLVPLMPTFGLAVTVLLLRHALSQMDVPTRQSYVNAMVVPGERAAANGVTGTVRQLAAALAPLLAGPLFSVATWAAAPFYVCGGLKVIYDLALWRAFRTTKPPEER